MTAGAIETELRAIGQQLSRWQAQHRAVLTAAVVLAALAVAAVADIVWHLERPGRLVAVGVVAVLAIAGLVLIGLALAARRTPESVAARIEHCFPELDNHLINVVQFAHRSATDELVTNYVRQGVPQWSGLDRRQLKNRRQHRRAWIALGVAAVVVLGPGLWTGAAWSNALARVLNPFSQRPASTLAHILELQPGDQVITTGQPVTFTCRVTGKRNQEIWLDLWPADDRNASIKLGSLGQAASTDAAETPATTPAAGESFRYVLPKLTSDLDYRLRAGDARSPRHRLTVRAPLALTAATLEVQPPAYTKLPRRTIDVLTEIPVVFQGADLAVRVAGNRPLRSASIAGQLAAAEGDLWTTTLPAFAGRSIPIAITATDGERLELDLACELVPDRAPQVRVIAPLAKTTLTPGATPAIRYEVTDDFGVGKVALQTTAGEMIEEWAAGDQPQFGALWNGPALGAGKTVSYRIVAWDHAHKAQSATIVFDTMTGQQLLAAAVRNTSETANTLSQLLLLQAQNLEKTVQLRAGLPGQAPASQWSPLRDTQGKIRQIAGQLLADPRKPLGALGPLVHDLHRTAMIQAVDALDRVPNSGGATQTGFADQAVALETRILRVLANTKDSLGRVEQHRQISGLLALLDALVTGQDEVTAATKAAIPDATRLPKGLTTRQDALAGDVSEFVQACHTEAQRLQNTDTEFAELVRQVAEACGTRQVGPNMLRAAEHLEQAQPADAVPFQDQALAALRDFQKLLNQWRIEQAQDAMTTVQQAVAEAAKKFDKLIELQAKVVDTLRAIEPQEDLSGKPEQAETMEELKALKANITDAALKIATDLHIFPELPVGNELVEDVYQVFEEVVQKPGSENTAADELGLQK
ncbi:hypothetical protein HQ590_16210, partial [bacterium]|nr:hypothetical protein [bacterium]